MRHINFWPIGEAIDTTDENQVSQTVSDNEEKSETTATIEEDNTYGKKTTK